jgi:predicted enzyme related to lactoylglutathione lyase
MDFYGGLFGWTFQIRTPDDAPMRYAYAVLDGLVVGGLGGPPTGASGTGWTHYIWVDSAGDTVAAVEANGGHVVEPPTETPHSGSSALCADPAGAVFGLWQPAENRGVQLVNAPGSWNFSELHTDDPDGAEQFYGRVFGWESNQLEMAPAQQVSMWRVPGYGDFLAQRDPDLYDRQEGASAPKGFADAVALMEAVPGDASGGAAAHWSLIFAVADADDAVARATDLGATLVTPLFDTDYTRMGTIRDPQGAIVTLSQYRPPQPG